jgi:hypothetical protein
MVLCRGASAGTGWYRIMPPYFSPLVYRKSTWLAGFDLRTALHLMFVWCRKYPLNFAELEGASLQVNLVPRGILDTSGSADESLGRQVADVAPYKFQRVLHVLLNRCAVVWRVGVSVSLRKSRCNASVYGHIKQPERSRWIQH